MLPSVIFTIYRGEGQGFGASGHSLLAMLTFKLLQLLESQLYYLYNGNTKSNFAMKVKKKIH